MTGLTPRLSTIVESLSPVKIFADIGCDHGYVALAMLALGKCERAIVTDVSPKCLAKAEKTLSAQFPGRFTAICADGLKGVPYSDEALVSGMGGDLIAKILKEGDYLPHKLVVQPMHGAEELRRALISYGYGILRDFTFKDVKFYDLIVAEYGRADLAAYSDADFAYGRDNLSELGAAFTERLTVARNKLALSLDNMSEKNRAEALGRIAALDAVIGKRDEI